MMLSTRLMKSGQSAIDTRRLGRAGMTLVELLTVLGIMILLAAIAIPTILSVIRGDRLRDASGSVQGFLTAARERAALDNRPRGIRLVPDADNPELVRQIIFIREADPIAPSGSMSGGAIVTGYLAANLGSTVPFYDTVEIPYDLQFVNTMIQSLPRSIIQLSRYNSGLVSVVRGVLRIGSAGPFRSFSFFPDDANYNLKTKDASGNTLAVPRTLLILDEPLPGPIGLDPGYLGSLSASGVGIEISRPPVPLEGVEPLVLPTGIVIDLGQLPTATDYPATLTIDPASQRLTRLTPRMSSIIQYSQGIPVDFGYDIMFSPQRNVIGPAAIDERIIIWLRDETGVLAEPDPNFVTQAANTAQKQAAVYRKQLNITSSTSNSLVALMTRTGVMGTYKPVLQDEVTETTGLAPPDGWFDWKDYYQNVINNVGVNE